MAKKKRKKKHAHDQESKIQEKTITIGRKKEWNGKCKLELNI